jgi:hypothetical protein
LGSILPCDLDKSRLMHNGDSFWRGAVERATASVMVFGFTVEIIP